MVRCIDIKLMVCTEEDITGWMTAVGKLSVQLEGLKLQKKEWTTLKAELCGDVNPATASASRGKRRIECIPYL